MPTPKHEQDDPRATHRDGKLTRAGMVRVIESGGAVSHQGTIYTRVDDLPDEATLAEGDAAAAEQALAALEADEARLATRRAALERTATRAREADAAKAKADEDAATKKAADDKAPTPPAPPAPPKK